MAHARTLTRSHVLKGVVALSVVSCFALPRGLDRPRQLFAPLLAPLGHGGTYICDTVRRNLTDLLSGDCDEQTAQDVLAANPEIGLRLNDAMTQGLRRRVAAYEHQVTQLRLKLAESTQARRALGDDFPCKLVPATIIASGATPYDRGRLLRASGRPAPDSVVTSREVLTNRPTAVPDAVAALNGSALVGRVTSSGAWTAHVQLVTDPDYQTRGFVSRMLYPDRQRLIKVVESDGRRDLLVQRPLAQDDQAIPVNLSGNGTTMISEAVPAHHAIEPGDLVVTAGDDGYLPLNIMIGYVSAVEPLADKPKHVRLTVRPDVDLSVLRRVYIVLPLAQGGR